MSLSDENKGHIGQAAAQAFNALFFSKVGVNVLIVCLLGGWTPISIAMLFIQSKKHRRSKLEEIERTGKDAELISALQGELVDFRVKLGGLSDENTSLKKKVQDLSPPSLQPEERQILQLLAKGGFVYSKTSNPLNLTSEKFQYHMDRISVWTDKQPHAQSHSGWSFKVTLSAKGREIAVKIGIM